MRLAIYGSVSSILAIGVIISAMYQRSNFYSACIYLSKSSACMMILLNMGLIIYILFGKLVQTIFFGRLRAIEIEHLYERSWYAVTETCLAMTIFREDFDLKFIVAFTTLLFLKIFHWLCQDRVEYMEQSPTNRVTFHVRIVNLLGLLFTVDALLAHHAIQVAFSSKGPNMMIMFGFEYTILLCSIASIIGKYALNVIDMQSEQTWEGKSMFVFYLDLVSDFFKLVAYIIFFLYICLNYQLPLHIVRDVYVTFRSFIQKCRDLYRYRRATRNMNELYPNATADDLSRSSDSTCIICREEMVVNDQPLEEENPELAAYGERNLDQPKKLPCGHIFHFHCLRSWLERQQTCPTCRRSVLADNNTPVAQPIPPMYQQPQQPGQQPGQAEERPPMYHTPSHQHIEGQPSFEPRHRPFSPQDYTSMNTRPFNIYEPSTRPSPIPGLIPLVPCTSIEPRPEWIPQDLNESDLQILSQYTREAMVRRLKVLEDIQNQLLASMQTLTLAISVIPPEPQPTETTVESIVEPTVESTAEPSTVIESSTPITNTRIESDHEEQEEEMSSRRKEKMPNYNDI